MNKRNIVEMWEVGEFSPFSRITKNDVKFSK